MSTQPSSLSRVLSPRSVAIVGVSEGRRMSDVAAGHLVDAGIELQLVSSRAVTAYGRPVFPSLEALGKPVDAVLSLVGAAASVEIAERAAALGCGGIVIVASGFAEAGRSGAVLQDRLRAVGETTGLAVIGPNCTGFANVPAGIALFTGMPVPVRAGALSIVSQSGYLTRAAMVAARERNLGVRLAISSGTRRRPAWRTTSTSSSRIRRPASSASSSRRCEARRPFSPPSPGRGRRASRSSH